MNNKPYYYADVVKVERTNSGLIKVTAQGINLQHKIGTATVYNPRKVVAKRWTGKTKMFTSGDAVFSNEGHLIYEALRWATQANQVCKVDQIKEMLGE